MPPIFGVPFPLTRRLGRSAATPPLADQINAVLATPVPFIVSVLPVFLATWWLFNWRYKAVFDKQKELYDMSAWKLAT
jgi:hypothetical protein